MPQLVPLSLTLPQQTVLHERRYRSVRGPAAFLNCLKQKSWSEIKTAVDQLLVSNAYQTQAAQHYWYRITRENQIFEGILTGVLLESNGTPISTHEAVLNERVRLFCDYLTAVDSQAEPLLLAHESPTFSSQLKGQICLKKPNFSYRMGQTQHQVWILPPPLAKAIESFAHKAAQFHLADGHHRLASSVKWGKQQHQKAVVLSFILAQDQLSIDSFLWALKEDTFLDNIKKEAVAYDPALPLWVQTPEGIYSLAVPKSETPVLYLYETLLGGTKAALTSKMDYYPLGSMPTHLRSNYAAIFGFKPLTTEEIIRLAKEGKKLPPKSTYIAPKLPTGLFIAPLSMT